MEELSQFNGYDPDFLQADRRVLLPRLDRQLRATVAPVAGVRNNVLHYQNFSLIQSADRGFPILTATNIDGTQFRSLSRSDRWRLDPRINEAHQWGPELYRADKSDFDRGHMTKREDVQWGTTDEIARRGALSTFFYTNAVPQVAKLNQQLWRGLEDYILKSETVSLGRRIAMFTGPVLADDDPVFVTPVADREVRIPTLFWKVIYFTKSDGLLYRVGFLMGQEELLDKMELVHPRETTRVFPPAEEEDLFMDFSGADVYQVNIRTISQLARLRFTAAREPFEDDRAVALIEREVQTRRFGEENAPLIMIDGLRL